jgi:hypothetical protein
MWWSGSRGKRGEGEAATTGEFSAALHNWELAITRASFVPFLFVVAKGKLLPETQIDCKETRKAVAKKQTKKRKKRNKTANKQTNKQKRRNAQERQASLTLITEH